MSSNPEAFPIKGKGIYIITDTPTWKGTEITAAIPDRRETGSASYKSYFVHGLGFSQKQLTCCFDAVAGGVWLEQGGVRPSNPEVRGV